MQLVEQLGCPAAEIVAKRLVEHLQRSGYVIMRRPPAPGASALALGFGEK